jgi:cation-transporting ATPase 13A3/4/5
MSARVLVSLLVQFFIQFIAQTFILFHIRSQPFYQPPTFYKDEDEEEGTNGLTMSLENTALFLVSIFQYICVAIVYSAGPPFRQRIISNVPYMVTATFFSIVGVLITLISNDLVCEWIELIDISFGYRLVIFVTVIVYVLLALASEQWMIPWVAQRVERAPIKEAKCHDKAGRAV